MPEIERGVGAELITSSFDGTPFSWSPNNPTWEKKEGLEHYGGEILCFRREDVSALLNLWKPVTITQTGDGMNVYIDYWGPDPSRTLVIKGQTIADHAILLQFRQGQYQFQEIPHYNPDHTVDFVEYVGVARCQVEFIITDDVAGAGGGGGAGGGISGTAAYTLAPSGTANAQALNLWNGTTNAPEPTDPTDWFDPAYDSSWWLPAGVAFTSGGDFFSGTQPIWSAEGVDIMQEVLFRHTFDVPAGTISSAELDVLVHGCEISVWVNGTSVATTIDPESPGWAINVASHLTAGASNLIAISATASLAVAYVSYKLAVVIAS